MLRTIRIFLEVVFFLGITLLFVGIGQDWWGWMAKLQFLPAILRLAGGFTLGNAVIVFGILLMTLIFGRIYCSVICPMGVFQDVVIWIRRESGLIINRVNRRRVSGYAASHNNNLRASNSVVLKPFVKHFKFTGDRKFIRIITLAVLVASVFTSGQVLISLVAPYSAYGRMVHSVVLNPETALLVTSGVTFVVITLCAWMWGRGWCNTICPVGTVLGYVAKASLFKIHIDGNKCVSCGRCVRSCKTFCMDMDAHSVDHSRCIDCFDCIGRCKEGAVSYGIKPAVSGTPKAGRRAFLATAFLLAGNAVGHAQEKKKDGGLLPVAPKANPGRTAPIVPPGALSVRNFHDHCTACQLCVSSCPNGVLKTGTGLEHFLQPVMGYQKGWCRPECTGCSDICPSGAIRPIQKDKKTLIKIGTARINPELCLTIRGEENCGSCTSHCPTGAVTMVKDKEHGTQRPVVAEQQCIGCGACEYLCPSRPVSAIVVEGLDVHMEK